MNRSKSLGPVVVLLIVGICCWALNVSAETQPMRDVAGALTMTIIAITQIIFDSYYTVIFREL
jgi:hypothetical protein